MSSGFGRRPNPPPLLRYASCAAGLTPANEVEFKLISSKCLVVCAAERSKGGGFGLAEAGGHERRSACHQAFASPTIPNYNSLGQGNKRRAKLQQTQRQEKSYLVPPSSLIISAPSPKDNKPDCAEIPSLARVSVMSKLRIVNCPIRSSGVKGASSTFSILKRSGA